MDAAIFERMVSMGHALDRNSGVPPAVLNRRLPLLLLLQVPSVIPNSTTASGHADGLKGSQQKVQTKVGRQTARGKLRPPARRS